MPNNVYHVHSSRLPDYQATTDYHGTTVPYPTTHLQERPGFLVDGRPRHDGEATHDARHGPSAAAAG